MPEILSQLSEVYSRYHYLITVLITIFVAGLLSFSTAARNTGSKRGEKRMRPGFGLRWVSLLWFPFAGILIWSYFQSDPELRHVPALMAIASIIAGFWGLAAGQVIEISWSKTRIKKQGFFKNKIIKWDELAVTGYNKWLQAYWIMDTAGTKIYFSQMFDGHEVFSEDVLAYLESVGGVPFEG